jgi:hypothetical protein
MAEVIKEVTKELQAEKAQKEGRSTTIPREETQEKPKRGCLLWRKDGKAEEKLKKEIEADDEGDQTRTEKKGMFDVARKWKSAKNGKNLIRKKYVSWPALGAFYLTDDITGDASSEDTCWHSLKWPTPWTTKRMKGCYEKTSIVTLRCTFEEL